MVSTSQRTLVTTRARPRLALALLCGAPFLAGLDLFVVNVAFPAITAGFPGRSLAEVSWALSGYAIVYAALLIPLGRWADRVGPKRVFVAGLVVFTAASAVCAASPELWVLVVFRVVQAAGAAAVTPTSLGMLLHAAPPARRAVSVRVWAASSAVAAALGPVVGGLLAEASWRWIFLINVPLGLILVAMVARMIPDYRAADSATGLDLAGAALLTVGIGALALALVQGNGWGWHSPGVLASAAVAVLGLVGFAVNTMRQTDPLIDPALLRVRSFTWANIGMLVFSASFAAGLLAVVLWLQEVWGYSALQTGLAVAPGPLIVPVFAVGGQLLARKVSAGTLACAGSLLWALGAVLLLSSVGPEAHYARDVLPGWLLAGAGVGLALPTILSAATAALPPAQSATGSAVVNMTRQVGTVLGISVLIAVLGTPVGYSATHTAFVRAWWTVAAIGVAASALSLGLSARKAAR